MRVSWMVCTVIGVAGCGAAGPKDTSKLTSACTSANADPGACLAIAKHRLAARDEDGARDHMEKLVVAINAAPACLRDHAADGCFAGVVALLHDAPVGLLAPYAVDAELLHLVPRWTGSDATGPRMQARVALQGMCTVPGRDPLAQQRACIVLADLVEDERTKRCGLDCDPKTATGGWSSTDVIDGYAAACKVDTSPAAADARRAFGLELARIYNVPAAGGICALSTSTHRGASIPDALATKARILADTRQRESSARAAARREAERLAAMEKQKVLAAAQAATAEAAAFRDAMLPAIAKGDWPLVYGLLTRNRGTAIEESVATALFRQWDPFAIWVMEQSTTVGAYLDLTSRLAKIPRGHSLHTALTTMRDNALEDAKRTARGARGLGGAWLHAALIARVAGPSATPEAQAAAAAHAKLVAATKVSLVIDNLAPACSSLLKPQPGRIVKAKSTLVCTVEPERTFTTQEPFKLKQRVVTAEGEQDIEQDTTVEVTHRTTKIVVHGTITTRSPSRTLEANVETIVDDVDGSDPRSFETLRGAAILALHQQLVAPLEAADAEKAHAAGLQALKVKRTAAAENHLVTHALLTGTSSPELDEILATYGVTWMDIHAQP